MAERLTGRRGVALRRLVIATYGTTCHLCGRDCADDLTVDHVTPLALGGTNDLDNLRPAHGRRTTGCPGNYGRGAAPVTTGRAAAWSRAWT